MSNRINQIRVWSKFFGQFGVYQKHSVQVFTTPNGAAAHIKDLGITPKGAQVFSTGQHFDRAEVGNERGWVTYEVNPEDNFIELSNSLDAAMEMHLGFYDEGETDKENAA